MTEHQAEYALDIVDGAHSRAIKVMGVVIVALVVVLALTIVIFTSALRRNNEKWLEYLSQYDVAVTTTEYTQDGAGLNLIGDRNGVNYYGAEVENDDADEDEEIPDAGEGDAG